MRLSRRLVSTVSAAVAAVLIAASPAAAMTEARIDQVSCHGFHVSQKGLPRHQQFRVLAFNPDDLRTLARATVSSGRNGTISLHLRADLHGLHRLAVDVEHITDGDEYGETGLDLYGLCGGRKSVTAGMAPVTTTAARSAAPAASAAPADVPVAARPRAHSSSVAERVAAATGATLFLLVLLLGLVHVQRRRAR